jgi:hypothetical protein
LKAIAVDSDFSIAISPYREGDEALAVEYLQSRSRLGELKDDDALPSVFRARLLLSEDGASEG